MIEPRIPQQQNTLAGCFKSFGKGGDGGHNRVFQLCDLVANRADELVLLSYLPVDLAAVRDNSLAFQRLRCRTLMDGRDLIQSPCGVRAVVNAFLPPGAFRQQLDVSPCRPPCRNVPRCSALGDGILPAVAGTFGMLVSPDKPVPRRRRCHTRCRPWDIASPSPRSVPSELMAVKPRSSPCLMQRYSFSVLYCHLPVHPVGAPSRMWA